MRNPLKTALTLPFAVLALSQAHAAEPACDITGHWMSWSGGMASNEAPTHPFVFAVGDRGTAYIFQNERGDRATAFYDSNTKRFVVDRWDAGRGMVARVSRDCQTLDFGPTRWYRS